MLLADPIMSNTYRMTEFFLKLPQRFWRREYVFDYLATVFDTGMRTPACNGTHGWMTGIE